MTYYPLDKKRSAIYLQWQLLVCAEQLQQCGVGVYACVCADGPYIAFLDLLNDSHGDIAAS